jgi:hypothetical protein
MFGVVLEIGLMLDGSNWYLGLAEGGIGLSSSECVGDGGGRGVFCGSGCGCFDGQCLWSLS